MNKQVKYKLEKSGDFVIENYQQAQAFSSFFPGIAGTTGMPLWVFYVNRGQGIASFGTEDKSGSILEFCPANQAYRLTPLKGFRTFIKLDIAGRKILYEPFSQSGCPYTKMAKSQMRINPSYLEISETNSQLNIETKVTYLTVPKHPFAGLARCLSLTNNSDQKVPVQLLDGLPQIIPYGTNEWIQKYMSRTIEAWMQVLNLAQRAPFYVLKVNPQDKPELEYFDKGNFFLSYQLQDDHVRKLDVIVDPELIFGPDAPMNYPHLFARSDCFSVSAHQRSEGKTPSAFSYANFSLQPGESIQIISLFGNIDSPKSLNKVSRQIMTLEFFAEQLAENKAIISELQDSVFTKTNSNEFDHYTRQTFLDNLLRGGFPHSIATTGHPLVYYLYARKHGDLERDYNAFKLNPTYFSQGNGAYRDINQNRRNDILLNPDVKEDNIQTFLNALQPDGFNPLLVEGVSLTIHHGKPCRAIINKYFSRKEDKDKLNKFFSCTFTPGSLIAFLEQQKIKPKKREEFLKQIFALVLKEDIICPGEGFWIDHWTYNLDLILNYLSVYPEKLQHLLVGNKDFTFYDTYLRVLPRSRKYVCLNGKVRQLASVIEDKHKQHLISSRKTDATKVRTNYGKGHVYRTTLLVKLLSLVTNKMASLDPCGIGIEMEANKPGWCDSLNNLPSVFGSSASETAELKRLILFLQDVLTKLKRSLKKQTFPQELAEFIKGLVELAVQSLSTKAKNRDFNYWNQATGLKENYRHKVWVGFSGKEMPISLEYLEEALAIFSKKLEAALRKTINHNTKLPYTYFINQVTRFKRVDGSFVRPLAFKSKPVPYFLEAPVHLMKILKDSNQARTLYQAVRASQLYDRKLKMYKLNVSLESMPPELGRSRVFTPGWLENESVWLQMEYKYLLELLRAGLYHEFFQDIKHALVGFLNPAVYGRSTLENSSFIVSSVHPEESLHGRGFVARLSGSTTEFISIWLDMFLGRKLFHLNPKNELNLTFAPILPNWLFTEEQQSFNFRFPTGEEEVVIPKNTIAFAFLGKILVIYQNPKRKNTFGKNAVRPQKIRLTNNSGGKILFKGDTLSAKYAKAVREGKIKRIEIELG